MLGVEIQRADVTAVNEVLNAGDDRAVLDCLRRETTALVLMCRLRNEQKQEAWKEKRRAETGTDDGSDPLNESGPLELSSLFGGNDADQNL
jgi:hypothetical protein